MFNFKLGVDSTAECDLKNEKNQSCNAELDPNTVYTVFLIAVAHDYRDNEDMCNVVFVGEYATG